MVNWYINQTLFNTASTLTKQWLSKPSMDGRALVILQKQNNSFHENIHFPPDPPDNNSYSQCPTTELPDQKGQRDGCWKWSAWCTRHCIGSKRSPGHWGRKRCYCTLLRKWVPGQSTLENNPAGGSAKGRKSASRRRTGKYGRRCHHQHEPWC